MWFFNATRGRFAASTRKAASLHPRNARDGRRLTRRPLAADHETRQGDDLFDMAQGFRAA